MLEGFPEDEQGWGLEGRGRSPKEGTAKAKAVDGRRHRAFEKVQRGKRQQLERQHSPDHQDKALQAR